MSNEDHILSCFTIIFQFTDKMEVIEDTIKDTVKHIEEAEPISAHPDKLRDQIAANIVSCGLCSYTILY